MRILYLLGQPFPDRQAQCIQVMHMGVELARQGVETALHVRRMLVSDREELFGRFGLAPEPGFTIRELPDEGLGTLRRWTSPAFLGRLTRLVRRSGRGETVIYSRDRPGIEPARLAAIAGRVLRVPVLFEVHKIYGERMAEYYRDEAPSRGDQAEAYLDAKRRRLARVRQREIAMLRTVDGLVAINAGLAARLREVVGPHRPLVVLPSGADVPESVADDARRDLDVVYLGHIGEIKGVAVLVEAMARLPGRRLLIHGRARRESTIDGLRAFIARLGLADRVTLGGWIPPGDVPSILARARASALPYRGGWTETAVNVSPLKAFELMAHGVPVVASDLPSLREVIRDGRTGLIVPPDDPVALAAALKRLLEDRPLAARLASAARDVARAHSWRRRAERVVAFASEAARRSGKPRSVLCSGAGFRDDRRIATRRRDSWRTERPEP